MPEPQERRMTAACLVKKTNLNRTKMPTIDPGQV